MLFSRTLRFVQPKIKYINPLYNFSSYIKIDKSGDQSYIDTPIKTIMKRTGIHPRDVISLNLKENIFKEQYQQSSFQDEVVLVIRENGILISIGFLKAIVEKDQVTILSHDHPQVKNCTIQFCTLLQELNVKMNVEYKIPFELIVIESIFQQVKNTFERRSKLLKPIIDHFVEELSREDVQNIVLSQILPVKEGLLNLDSQLEQILDVIKELLQDDEDMSNMQLTLKSELANKNEKIDIQQHETVEVLFETFFRRINRVRKEINFQKQKLKDAQEIAEINIDLYRNKLVGLNAKMSVASVALTINSVIAGYFGMNLLSGIENVPGLFYIVITGSLSVSGCIFISYMNKIQSMAKIKKGQGQDMKALKWIINNLGPIEHSFKEIQNNDKEINKQQFVEILQKNTFQKLDGREADLLMYILDKSNDEILQISEYLDLFTQKDENVLKNQQQFDKD